MTKTLGDAAKEWKNGMRKFWESQRPTQMISEDDLFNALSRKTLELNKLQKDYEDLKGKHARIKGALGFKYEDKLDDVLENIKQLKTWQDQEDELAGVYTALGLDLWPSFGTVLERIEELEDNAKTAADVATYRANEIKRLKADNDALKEQLMNESETNKVTITKELAQAIEDGKANGWSLYGLISRTAIDSDEEMKLLERAWVLGYEVEKEPMYKIAHYVETKDGTKVVKFITNIYVEDMGWWTEDDEEVTVEFIDKYPLDAIPDQLKIFAVEVDE
jgi:DNA repair exonuclease SbcCD ATPase subunit